MNRTVGYFLSHEQFSPADLVEAAVAAEQAGFDSVWASDHFQPWQEKQVHAGNAWLTLAAAGQRTSRVLLGTAVTCPIYRNRPALVAQAFATLGVLYPGRVFLGVGTGEAVNELPAGGGWGPYRERRALLREAIELIRKLWNEDRVTHEGPGFSIANAKIYDKPSTPIPIYVAASGPRSAALAGEVGDGWMTNSAALLESPDIVKAFRDGASVAGVDPSAREVLVEQYVFVGSEDEAYAAAPLWQFAAVEHLVRDMDDPRDIFRDLDDKWKSSSSPKPLAAYDIMMQWVIALSGFAGAAFMIALFANVARQRYTFDYDSLTLALPDGTTVKPTDIDVFDKRKWHRFIVFLKLTQSHDKLGGKELRLDLLRYSPLETWVKQMFKEAHPDEYRESFPDEFAEPSSAESAGESSDKSPYESTGKSSDKSTDESTGESSGTKSSDAEQDGSTDSEQGAKADPSVKGD